MVVSILDFIYLQQLVFQPLGIIVGLVLVGVGGIIESKIRVELKKKAGMGSMSSTKRLLIVEGHQLITDGLYGVVRHPLYLGRILLHTGSVLILSSLYGFLLTAIGLMFFLVRIRIEEEMLLQAFGDEYRDYQKTTKKLIPYIY
jgi:protein-S-isoprenylcysteine O-methyltransferase Ste14